MSKKVNDRERRLQLRLEYLGSNNPRCIHCGEDDPFCLELHEPGGKDLSTLSVIECRNCHRKLEDPRKDHPKPLSKPRSDIECIAHFLLGLADWLQLLISHLRKHAEALIMRAASEQATGVGARS
jgi:hypothetical protein